MKKIFIILSVLFVGLLVGCASKPSSKKDEYSFPTEEELINQKYNDFVEKFTFMMYEKPVLSVHELRILAGYAQNSDFDNLSSDRNLVTSRSTSRKDFSMKISNTTEKDVIFRFIAKNFDNGPSDNSRKVIAEFTIPSNETYYILVENCVALGESSMTLFDTDEESFTNCYYMGPNKDFVLSDAQILNPNEYSFHKELYKFHSLVFIYDHVLTQEAYENDETAYGRTYNYYYVQPFDDEIKNEKNLIIIHQ